MKALIFAAGLGTRLRPLTDHMPKALVPVGGIPLLQRVILKLKKAGFDDMTINIHHHGQQIIDFLESKHNFDVSIHISDERERLLDTGGGILHARPFLDGDEPFLVHNADILTDADLGELFQIHQQKKATATLLVGQRVTSRYLLFDNHLYLHGWINKKTGQIRPEGLTGSYQEWAFGGIHMISPSIFRYMEKDKWQGKKFSIIDFYLNTCSYIHIAGCPIKATHWFDTGTPETLFRAEAWYNTFTR